jgi:hypothetical protein
VDRISWSWQRTLKRIANDIDNTKEQFKRA